MSLTNQDCVNFQNQTLSGSRIFARGIINNCRTDHHHHHHHQHHHHHHHQHQHHHHHHHHHQSSFLLLPSYPTVFERWSLSLAESLAAVPVQVGIGNGPIGLKRKTSLGLKIPPQKIRTLMAVLLMVLLMVKRGFLPPQGLNIWILQHTVFFAVLLLLGNRRAKQLSYDIVSLLKWQHHHQHLKIGLHDITIPMDSAHL